MRPRPAALDSIIVPPLVADDPDVQRFMESLLLDFRRDRVQLTARQCMHAAIRHFDRDDFMIDFWTH